MKRPPAVTTAAVLACVVGLAPAMTAAAATPAVPSNTASWIDGTLRIVWSTPPGGIDQWPASDVFLNVTVDGKSVDQLSDVVVDRRLVEVGRAAAAGPARVEVVLDACIDVTEGYDCTPHTIWSATVSQRTTQRKHGQVSAETLLRKLTVAKESHAGSYARARFAGWLDANRDGEDTRAEVLKAESRTKVAEDGSHVVTKGSWISPYDGKRLTRAPQLGIDHLVPLQEAWVSGASRWSAQKRAAYANDLGFAPSLVAVSKQSIRSKGGKEPDRWLPAKNVCAYVRDWIAVKYRWGLSVDASERKALQVDLAAFCSNLNVSQPGTPDIAVLVGAGKPAASEPLARATSDVDPGTGPAPS